MKNLKRIWQCFLRSKAYETFSSIENFFIFKVWASNMVSVTFNISILFILNVCVFNFKFLIVVKSGLDCFVVLNFLFVNYGKTIDRARILERLNVDKYQIRWNKNCALPFPLYFLPRNYYSTLANSKLLDINNDVNYLQYFKLGLIIWFKIKLGWV